MKYALVKIQLARQPEGGYIVTSPDVRGFVTEGDTVDEAIDMALDLARLLYETIRDHGLEMPAAYSAQPQGARFTLTIPVDLETPYPSPDLDDHEEASTEARGTDGESGD